MKDFFVTGPRMIVTGGGSPDLTDSTIGNFQHSLSLGADVIRTDLVLTREKKLVVISDKMAQDSTLKKQDISSLSIQEIREKYTRHAHTGDTSQYSDTDALFPELSVVLEAFPQVLFNLNILSQDREVPLLLAGLLKSMGVVSRILVSSYYGAPLKYLRNDVPELALSFSMYGLIGFYALYKSGLLSFRKRFSMDALLMPETIGTSYIANRGLIARARELGIVSYVYTDGNVKQVKRLSGAGLNGFITGDVESVIREMD